MIELTIFLKFLLALGLGALIGAERERFGGDGGAYKIFGGIRTFMFITLFGGLSTYISKIYFSWFIIPAFAGLIILISIGYFASVWASRGKDMGLTGEITALTAFLLGMLIFISEPIYAVVLAIILTTLLYLKNNLHGFIKNLSKDEIYSTLVFAIVAFVILPFLPNSTYGPLDVLNPYTIWLMVVFISGLSYVGYILIKVMGAHKGLGITGLLGGLVSSTAVTMSMATSSKKNKNEKIIKMLVFATIIANAVMFLRVIIEVYVVNKAILPQLIIPMSVMGAVALISALVLWLDKNKAKDTSEHDVEHTSPFTLGPAIKFGVLFAAVLLAVKLAEIYFGETGIYVASLISGFVDVDAITLTMANIAGNGITEKAAVMAITLAVMSNTIVKFGYAAIFGSKAFRKNIGIVFSLVIIAGIVAVLLM